MTSGVQVHQGGAATQKMSLSVQWCMTSPAPSASSVPSTTGTLSLYYGTARPVDVSAAHSATAASLLT
ncbi:hypothetical protein ADUPG1_005574, partial [Aduncisulcus paluster]